MTNKTISGRFELITPDVKKILTGALMAGIGAVATFVAENIQGVNFGDYTPFVSGFVAIIANIVRKWIAETKY